MVYDQTSELARNTGDAYSHGHFDGSELIVSRGCAFEVNLDILGFLKNVWK